MQANPELANKLSRDLPRSTDSRCGDILHLEMRAEKMYDGIIDYGMAVSFSKSQALGLRIVYDSHAAAVLSEEVTTHVVKTFRNNMSGCLRVNST